MNSNSKSPVSGNLTARKPNGKDVVSSAEPVKRDGQTGVSIATDVSGDPKKTKPNGKAVVSSTEPIRRTEQTGGSCANAVSGDLIPKKSNGKAAVSSAGTIKHSGGSGVPSAKTDEVLFFKDVKFGPQEDELSPVQFPEDRFRFYGYEEFEAASDVKGDLYYYVGHMKLVNEQTMNDSLVMNGHVMKLYLWDKAATDLCEKFKAHGNTPSVIMVTTVNPKRFGALSSLSSSRVFFDMDGNLYFRLSSNSDVANMVNAEIVTKAEIVTVGELFSYIKQEGAKVAWFECTATIDDVVHGSAWYYIAYGWCKAKATKGPTTLMCKKCGKAEVAGVAEYLTKLSVYDNNDQAFFVLLSDAGRELTGKPASELVESYFEANENVGDDHVIPVPQALIGTIGQTHKFNVKVLPPEAPAPEGNLEENMIVHSAEETLQMGNREDGPSIENEEAADEVGKRSFDGIESGEAKRAKCDIEPAITDPDRQLTIKIKRINQTEINFSISHKFASVIPSLNDYAGTHVRNCLSIRDFNPKATKMINLDVALIDQRNSRREPIPEEADKVCTICQDKLIGTGGVNSLRCSHKYHHLCIVEWIHHNLSCPTCRDTEL
ncbi:hypothetical protein Bca101_087654 [Brassica carinata]